MATQRDIDGYLLPESVHNALLSHQQMQFFMYLCPSTLSGEVTQGPSSCGFGLMYYPLSCFKFALVYHSLLFFKFSLVWPKLPTSLRHLPYLFFSSATIVVHPSISVIWFGCSMEISFFLALSSLPLLGETRCTVAACGQPLSVGGRNRGKIRSRWERRVWMDRERLVEAQDEETSGGIAERGREREEQEWNKKEMSLWTWWSWF